MKRRRIVLYRCPSLSAWISEKQCAVNHAIGRKAARSSQGTIAWSEGAVLREFCPQCPGVKALRAGRREWPEHGELATRASAAAPARRGLKSRISAAQHRQLEEQRAAKRVTSRSASLEGGRRP